MNTTKILTIAYMYRLPGSSAGNPRWLVTFTTGDQHKTKARSMVGYLLQSSDYKDTPVEVTFSPKGEIQDVHFAPDEMQALRDEIKRLWTENDRLRRIIKDTSDEIGEMADTCMGAVVDLDDEQS